MVQVVLARLTATNKSIDLVFEKKKLLHGSRVVAGGMPPNPDFQDELLLKKAGQVHLFNWRIINREKIRTLHLIASALYR